jgi:hypothetical protein
LSRGIGAIIKVRKEVISWLISSGKQGTRAAVLVVSVSPGNESEIAVN